MIVCTYCGKNNADGARFCEACGKPLIIQSGSMAIQNSGVIEASASGYGNGAIAVRYAGFWLRVVAAIIDSIILTIPSAIWAFFVDDTYNIMSLFLSWLYFAYFESSEKQATLGKMIMGLRVTDLLGRRVSFWRATGRWAGKTLSFLLLGIGYIMIAFTRKKQGLHDMMAGCLVVKK